MDIRLYSRLADFSQGKKKADIVFKNANIVFVQSGEIVKADIAIADKYIVGIGSYDGIKEIDMTDKFIAPGFIDSHLHFESTMARPSDLVYYASRSGTTTFIADPHEAANVSGIRGIEYILNETNNCFADVYIMVPSCVPCVEGEDSGYRIDVEDMKKIIKSNRVLGLAEVMDCKAVIDRSNPMMEKMELFDDMVIDGHAIGLSDKDLSSYILSGVKTDHECTLFEDAMRKVRNGMFVQIREGSAAKNLDNIISGILNNNIDTSRFLFCTDDKHIEDIIKEGHISYNIKKSIKKGIDVVEAYKIASYNPSVCYNLKDVGMIAVGKKANLVVLRDLENVLIEDVYYEGRSIEDYRQKVDREDCRQSFDRKDCKQKDAIEDCIQSFVREDCIQSFDRKDYRQNYSREGIDELKEKLYENNIKKADTAIETIEQSKGMDFIKFMDDLKNTVHIDWFKKEMLKLKEDKISILFQDNELLTKKINRSDGIGTENKVTTIERHHNKKKYCSVSCFNFGIKNGAIATSVAHDSHNIVVIGDNDDDMFIALEELKRLQGGVVLVCNGKVFDSLPLPIMGLICDGDSAIISEKLERMKVKSYEMGVNKNIDPFITLSFIALPVIPEIRITTNGIWTI